MNDDTRKRKLPRGVFERPKGSGIYWVRYHDQNGQEHRERAGTSLKLAKDIYAKRKTEVREGRFFPKELIRRREVRVADAMDAYVEARRDRASHREMERYAKHWKAELGGRTLRQVDETQVERIAAGRREKVSEQTVAHELIFLRAIFKRAIIDGTADRNPVGKVPAPRNQRVRYLAADEEARLREKLETADCELVDFAINTGLRQGRQFSLRWTHVDLANSVIRIPKSKNRDAYTVPLNDTAKRILQRRPRRLHCPGVPQRERGELPRRAQFRPARVQPGGGGRRHRGLSLA